MTTIAALADSCSTRFRDPSHQVLSCDQWYDYLNQAWKKIQQTTSQWPWNANPDAITVTVAANQRQGCLSETSEVLEVKYVIDTTNDRPLKQQTGDGGFQRLQGNSNVGKSSFPESYTVKGNEIELFPIPNQIITLEIRGVKWATTLAYNAAPPFPEAFHTVLIPGAMAAAHLDDGNYDAYKVFTAEFNEGIQSLAGSFLNGGEEKYPLIPVDSV